MKRKLMAVGLLSISTLGISGPYLFIEGGYSTVDTNKSGYLTSGYNQTGFGARFGGGYLFKTSDKIKVGVEGGYTRLPGVSWDFGTDIINLIPIHFSRKNKTIDTLLVFNLEAGDRFNLFAKPGISFENQSISIKSAHNQEKINRTLKTNTVNPTFILGVSYAVYKNLSITGSVRYSFGEIGRVKTLNAPIEKIPDIFSTFVGLQYNF